MIKPTTWDRVKHAYGLYYIIPLTCAAVWLAGLLTLIGLWARDGTPRYADDPSGAPILFVSNVGAEYQKVFIGFCVPTAALFLLTLLLERWLRHVDRIPTIHSHKGQRKIIIYDLLAIGFALIGCIALILLSAFNDIDFSTVHWVSAAVFVVTVAISAIFQSLEVFNLKKGHPDRAHLLRNAILKLFIIALAIAIAIAFAALYGTCSGDVDYSASPSEIRKCKRVTSAAAVCEWVIALVLDAYFLTLVLDLWPANKTSPRFLRRLERGEQNILDKVGVNNGRDSFSNGRLSTGSTLAGTPPAPVAVDVDHVGGTNHVKLNQMAEKEIIPSPVVAAPAPAQQVYQPTPPVQPVFQPSPAQTFYGDESAYGAHPVHQQHHHHDVAPVALAPPIN